MTTEKNSSTHDHHGRKGMANPNVSGGIYGMAFIGAAIYYIMNATSFWVGVLGVLKAIIWPVLLIFKILEFLKM